MYGWLCKSVFRLFFLVVSMRLKSVKNIQKITKSMKMVSAAKFGRAERDLRTARVYGSGATGEPTYILVDCPQERSR